MILPSLQWLKSLLNKKVDITIQPQQHFNGDHYCVWVVCNAEMHEVKHLIIP